MKKQDFRTSVMSWLKKQGAFAEEYKEDMVFFCKEGFYGFLECKAAKDSPKQPGQPQFIKKMHNWSYGEFCYPENWERIQAELEGMLA